MTAHTAQGGGGKLGGDRWKIHINEDFEVAFAMSAEKQILHILLTFSD